MPFETRWGLTPVAGGDTLTVPSSIPPSVRCYAARCAASPDITVKLAAGASKVALPSSRLFPIACLAALGSSSRQLAVNRPKQRATSRTQHLGRTRSQQSTPGDAPVKHVTTDKVLKPFGAHAGKNEHIGKRDYRVEASGEHTVAVPLPLRANSAASLTKYMQLPASQYALISLPFGASLERVRERVALEDGQELFELVVPYVNIPGVVSVQPVVMCIVRPCSAEVVIEGTECILLGEDALKYRLNDRFRFSVRTTLSWKDEDTTRSINIASHIKVNVDPPSIFRKLMPKAWLERLGNTMVGATLRYLQGGFIQSLANDYSIWEADPDYREARARFI